MKSYKVRFDPRVTSLAQSMADLGFASNGAFKIKTLGDFSASANPDNPYHQDAFQNLIIKYAIIDQHIGAEYAQFQFLKLSDLLTIQNGDFPISDNSDPDGDYGFEIVPLLFSTFKDEVNFNSLSKAQTDAISNKDDRYNSSDDEDEVQLPNKGVNLVGGWDEKKYFLAGTANDIVRGG